ncbi:MAG: L-rhamnose mutarotase [Actinobacteria bacterium]|nr:L-rhamnose mutarotase [Actinomycetota bacterium]
MEEIVFVQRVKKERLDEYLEYHRNVWPELLKVMKNAGIENMLLWLYGDLVIVYVIAKNFDRNMAETAKAEVFQKWQETMKPLLSEIQDYSEEGKIKRLEKIFDLNEQLRNI